MLFGLAKLNSTSTTASLSYEARVHEETFLSNKFVIKFVFKFFLSSF